MRLILLSDGTTPIGPCIVSVAQIPDPQAVPLKLALNGKPMQDGLTACVVLSHHRIDYRPWSRSQIFSIRKTIALLSQGTTLLPGSLIMTGTPKGVGFVRKPRVFMKHGDEVSAWFGGGIGTLVNRVSEEGKEKSRL